MHRIEQIINECFMSEKSIISSLENYLYNQKSYDRKEVIVKDLKKFLSNRKELDGLIANIYEHQLSSFPFDLSPVKNKPISREFVDEVDVLRHEAFNKRYDELLSITNETLDKLISHFPKKEQSKENQEIKAFKDSKIGIMLNKPHHQKFIIAIREPLIKQGFISHINETKFINYFNSPLPKSFEKIVWIEPKRYTLTTLIKFLRDNKIIDTENDYWLGAENIFLDKDFKPFLKKKIQYYSDKLIKTPNRVTELTEILETALSKINQK